MCELSLSPKIYPIFGFPLLSISYLSDCAPKDPFNEGKTGRIMHKPNIFTPKVFVCLCLSLHNTYIHIYTNNRLNWFGNIKTGLSNLDTENSCFCPSYTVLTQLVMPIILSLNDICENILKLMFIFLTDCFLTTLLFS